MSNPFRVLHNKYIYIPMYRFDLYPAMSYSTLMVLSTRISRTYKFIILYWLFRFPLFIICVFFIFISNIIITGLSVVTLEKALEINRISAKVGDNVEIRCDVSGNPPPPIVWKRYSADLTTLGDEDVRVFSDGSLYLTKIQLVHAGNYTCRALRNSEVTQTHVLTVHSMYRYLYIMYTNYYRILPFIIGISWCLSFARS